MTKGRGGRSPARRDPDPDDPMDWFGWHYGINRDALRGTEWERWVRWSWEDDPEPGPHCEWTPPGQGTLGLA